MDITSSMQSDSEQIDQTQLLDTQSHPNHINIHDNLNKVVNTILDKCDGNDTEFIHRLNYLNEKHHSDGYAIDVLDSQDSSQQDSWEEMNFESNLIGVNDSN